MTVPCILIIMLYHTYFVCGPDFTVIVVSFHVLLWQGLYISHHRGTLLFCKWSQVHCKLWHCEHRHTQRVRNRDKGDGCAKTKTKKMYLASSKRQGEIFLLCCDFNQVVWHRAFSALAGWYGEKERGQMGKEMEQQEQTKEIKKQCEWEIERDNGWHWEVACYPQELQGRVCTPVISLSILNKQVESL